MNRLLTIVLSCFLIVGCKLAPQEGGTAQHESQHPGRPGPTKSSVNQPENPQHPSTHRSEIKSRIETEFPAGTVFERGTNGTERIEAPEPVKRVEEYEDKWWTEIGASWQDTARELTAKLQNMKPIMWVGAAVMVLVPIVAYKMGWPIIAIMGGAIGLGMMVLAQVLPGNEGIVLIGGLVVLVLGGLVVVYAYRSGQIGELVGQS